MTKTMNTVVPMWRWVRKPTQLGLGVLEIKGIPYALQHAVDHDKGRPVVRGYRLTNCQNGEEYDMEITDHGLTCECKDFAYRGSKRPCKHVLALTRALGIGD